ncbi:MAG: YceD family protein [Bacteroidales bacterium]
MGYLKQYILPFSGLSLDKHYYHFDIDGKFFAEFEYTEIEQASINVDLTLDRQERMLVLDFAINGSINVMCDRCLDNFDFTVDKHERLIVKLGDKWEEESEDILIIPESEHQIDISSYLYEYIVLMLPIKKTHPEDKDGNTKCNPEIINKLNELSKPEPDSRWDSLKGLLSEN